MKIHVCDFFCCISLYDSFHSSELRSAYRSTTIGVIDKQKDMLDFINEPQDSSVGDDPPNVPPEKDELADLVQCIVKAADGRKADNIVALRVSPVTTLTSFMVILSGNSRPQNQAIAAAIQEDVAEQFDLHPGSQGVPEGSAESGWMVLDFGSVMVHIMTPKSRLYYNVEGQWRDKGGEYMDLSNILVPNTMQEPTVGGTMNVEKEDDPFWS